jgi:hypothetical protein
MEVCGCLQAQHLLTQYAKSPHAHPLQSCSLHLGKTLLLAVAVISILITAEGLVIITLVVFDTDLIIVVPSVVLQQEYTQARQMQAADT